jgi:hypothetical protein
VGGVVVKKQGIEGLPEDVWGNNMIGLVPTTHFMRLLIGRNLHNLNANK